MLEILELTLFVIIVIGGVILLGLPAVYAIITGNDKWLYGLIITVPFGMALLIYMASCNEWMESLLPPCI